MVFHLLQKYRWIIHCEVITETPFLNLHPPQYVCVYAERYKEELEPGIQTSVRTLSKWVIHISPYLH